MGNHREALLGVFDEASSRLTRRLVGLTDAEYRWEPAPGCWSVRPGAGGSWVLDGFQPTPEPAPLTTIAWRTCHLGGHVLSGFANWVRDGESPFEGDPLIPGTAAAAVAFLESHYARWREGIAGFPETRLWAPIGEEFGPFAEASAYDLMLHVLDEYIHHAAEIALLRDLYQHLA